MSWRKHLLPGSFRGVPFFVQSHKTKFGRRVKVHEYYKRDVCWAQDKGQAADEFNVEGFVIQNAQNNFDHFPERDDLIYALKAKGQAKLCHPWLGELNVTVNNLAELSETYTEGGVARFSMFFVHSGRERFRKVKKDFTASVDLAAVKAVGTAKDSFYDKFKSSKSFAKGVISDIKQTVRKMQNAVTAVKGAISSVTAEVTSTLSTIITDIDMYLDAPCYIAGKLTDSAGAMQRILGMAGDLVYGRETGSCSGQERAAGTILTGASIPPALGNSAVRSLVNSLSTSGDQDVSNLNNVATLANASMIAVRIDYTNRDSMLGNLQLINNALCDLQHVLGDGDYRAVSDLKAAFIGAMIGKYSDLVEILEMETPDYGIKSTLTLAYDLYGDVSRCAEIRDNNQTKVRHPGFLPNQDFIEVLSA